MLNNTFNVFHLGCEVIGAQNLFFFFKDSKLSRRNKLEINSDNAAVSLN